MIMLDKFDWTGFPPPKPGDKLVCLDNKYYSLVLTVGTEYEVREVYNSQLSSTSWSVKMKGNETVFTASRFKPTLKTGDKVICIDSPLESQTNKYGIAKGDVFTISFMGPTTVVFKERAPKANNSTLHYETSCFDHYQLYPELHKKEPPKEEPKPSPPAQKRYEWKKEELPKEGDEVRFINNDDGASYKPLEIGKIYKVFRSWAGNEMWIKVDAGASGLIDTFAWRFEPVEKPIVAVDPTKWTGWTSDNLPKPGDILTCIRGTAGGALRTGTEYEVDKIEPFSNGAYSVVYVKGRLVESDGWHLERFEPAGKSTNPSLPNWKGWTKDNLPQPGDILICCTNSELPYFSMNGEAEVLKVEGNLSGSIPMSVYFTSYKHRDFLLRNFRPKKERKAEPKSNTMQPERKWTEANMPEKGSILWPMENHETLEKGKCYEVEEVKDRKLVDRAIIYLKGISIGYFLRRFTPPFVSQSNNPDQSTNFQTIKSNQNVTGTSTDQEALKVRRTHLSIGGGQGQAPQPIQSRRGRIRLGR